MNERSTIHCRSKERSNANANERPKERSDNRAVQTVRLSMIIPPPPGYLQSLPERVLARRAARLRKRNAMLAGACAAALLTLVVPRIVPQTLFWNGAETERAAQPYAPPESSKDAVAKDAVEGQSARQSEPMTPRQLGSGEKQERPPRADRRVSAPARELTGMAVENLARLDTGAPAADPSVDGETAPLEWNPIGPATAARWIASLERRLDPFAQPRRSAASARGLVNSALAPLLAPQSSPTDEVRLPQQARL